MRHRNIGLIVAGLISGAAIAALMFGLQARQAGAPQSVVSGTALVGGPFALTDHTGKKVTEKDYLGKFMLVFFGFTNCPDICPSGLQVISAALDKLGPKAELVTPVFISFDPSRDTPEKLAAYLKSFHPRLIGLTGSDAEVAAVAKAYRVYLQKVTDEKSPGTYSFDHAAIFYVMGKDGAFVTHVPHTNDVGELTAALDKVLK